MKNPNFSGSVKNNLTNTEIVEPIVNHVANIFFAKIENDEESIKNLMNSFEVQRRIKNQKKCP